MHRQTTTDPATHKAAATTATAAAQSPERAMLDALAAALSYPGGDAAARIARTAATVRGAAGSAAERELAAALQRLAAWIGRAAAGEPEERYTGLFDLSPVCTLNLGYHLFGESYERGALLAGLTRELLRVQLAPGDEIPDALPVVLRLLARMTDSDDRRLLLGALLLPALAKMTAVLTRSQDPWSDLLRALAVYLGELGAAVGCEPPPPEAARLPIIPAGAVPAGEEGAHA